MTIGARIRAARLEAGLSQRELAGDVMTRNMLSVLEHDGANPSLGSLQYLARKLHRPVGYFLGEETGDCRNLELAESAPDDRAFLEAMRQIPAPDRVLMLRARAALLEEDPERAIRYLNACDGREEPEWNLWMGRALMACSRWQEAARALSRAEDVCPEVLEDLENCYFRMEDFKMAYHYAKKREKTGS